MAGITLHVNGLKGENSHHCAEASKPPTVAIRAVSQRIVGQ